MNKVRDKMIEFIIIENNKEYIEKYKRIITKQMLNNDYEYKISINIEKYDTDNFKVYIISYTNDEIIEKVRYNNWSSMLIITLDNETNICHIVNNRWMPIDIILKTYDFDKYFTRAINISLNNFLNRPNTLKYTYKNVFYNIPINEILWIQKEKEEKRCLIKTTANTYLTNESISCISNKIGNGFTKCNRSMLINNKQVREYNIKKNIIVFNNGDTYQDISRNCKKDIINYLRRVE